MQRKNSSLAHMHSRTHHVPRSGGTSLEQTGLLLHKDGRHQSASSHWTVQIDHITRCHGVHKDSCGLRAQGTGNWAQRVLSMNLRCEMRT